MALSGRIEPDAAPKSESCNEKQFNPFIPSTPM
jgi:hypothetical protein